MKLFYGAAIQGAESRQARAHVHSTIISTVKDLGHTVLTEHTAGKTAEEAAELLEKAIGPLPPLGIERRIFVRRKMIEFVESDIDAAIFEVSVPSLGTGIEIAHAYLRKKTGLKEIPILLLYEKGHWPNKLSTMVRGITPEEIPSATLIDYTDLKDARTHIKAFLQKCAE